MSHARLRVHARHVLPAALALGQVAAACSLVDLSGYVGGESSPLGDGGANTAATVNGSDSEASDPSPPPPVADGSASDGGGGMDSGTDAPDGNPPAPSFCTGKNAVVCSDFDDNASVAVGWSELNLLGTLPEHFTKVSDVFLSAPRSARAYAPSASEGKRRQSRLDWASPAAPSWVHLEAKIRPRQLGSSAPANVLTLAFYRSDGRVGSLEIRVGANGTSLGVGLDWLDYTTFTFARKNLTLDTWGLVAVDVGVKTGRVDVRIDGVDPLLAVPYLPSGSAVTLVGAYAGIVSYVGATPIELNFDDVLLDMMP